MLPFEIAEPEGGDSPLLVEVPHAGLWLDAEALAWTAAPARSLARDADLHVDALFQDAPAEGASLLVSHTSRYFVDLNRAESDSDGGAVEGARSANSPRGIVWRLTADGEPALERPLSRFELQRRLELVYRPYHRLLAATLDRKRARFGFAVLLCAHSMPSRARRSGADADGSALRADIVPGSRGRTTASPHVIDRLDAHARASGYTVRHDDPYRGGFSTYHYGKPGHGIHAIQVEIARRLYMDEAALRIDPQGFAAVRQFARTLVARLLFTEPDAPLGLRCTTAPAAPGTGRA